MPEDRNPWTPDWSNAVFSLAERDQRWAKVRRLMRDNGVDLILCFPCTNSHDRGQADARYLTQLGENSDETTVAFPIEGNVTAWHSRGGVWPSSNWFADIRATGRGTGGATSLDWIRENPRFLSATIAIAGLDSTELTHVRSAEGEVNWQSVDMLKRELPKARIVSASKVLGLARWRKSAEEIEFLRKGTEVAEATLDAMHKYARAGVSERHVFGQMMFANADAGGSFTPMFGWATGPNGRTYHRVEQPSFRVFQPGDALVVEIEGRWAGYIAQIDQTVCIGHQQPEKGEAMKLAFEAYDRVMAKLKPGVTVRELIAAAKITGLNGRIETGLGGHGRGTGDDGPLLVARRAEGNSVLDIVIEEDCSFVIKPSAALDGEGDYARWGETVVVTRTGAKRLGTRPQEMRVL